MPVAVVVVDRLVVLGSVIDDTVLEGNTTLVAPIGEPEVVVDLEAAGRQLLLPFTQLHGVEAEIDRLRPRDLAPLSLGSGC